MAPVVAVIVGSSSTTRATPHEPQYRYTRPSVSVKTCGSMTSWPLVDVPNTSVQVSSGAPTASVHGPSGPSETATPIAIRLGTAVFSHCTGAYQ